MLRSVACALGAATAGTAACLAGLTFTGGSAEDAVGFGVLGFTSSLALALIVYLPAFALTRVRHWSRPSAILLTVTLLNAPGYVVLLAGLWRGGLFGGWSEIVLFAGAYAIAGIVFAWCTSARSS